MDGGVCAVKVFQFASSRVLWNVLRMRAIISWDKLWISVDACFDHADFLHALVP